MTSEALENVNFEPFRGFLDVLDALVVSRCLVFETFSIDILFSERINTSGIFTARVNKLGYFVPVDDFPDKDVHNLLCCEGCDWVFVVYHYGDAVKCDYSASYLS